MSRLGFSALVLVFLLGACGRYGPPERAYTPAPNQQDEERQEQATP